MQKNPTPPTSPNTSRFSFLHRRPFWVVTYGLVIIVSFLLSPSPVDLNEVKDITTSLAMTFGGLLWISILDTLTLKLFGGYLLSILYDLLMAYLVVKTFKEKFVLLRYPFLFLTLITIGYIFLIGIYGL